MSALSNALELFRDTIPARPRCTDDKHLGQYYQPKQKALQHRLIQPNMDGRVVWVCFDVDRPGSGLDWYDRGAPPPTLVMENPRNGHAHLAYALEAPVPKTEAARLKPLLYLASTKEGIRRVVGGDVGYSGGLVKTPGHEAWQTQSYAGTYALGDLAEWVTLPSPAEILKKARDPDYAGLGRNCLLFEMLRAYGYKAVRKYWRPGGFELFARDMEGHACDLARANNPRDPLPEKEARAVAKSQARWIWRTFSPSGFRAYQSAVGARKGIEKRNELLERAKWMATMGQTQREIAAATGVSQKTVSNWLQRRMTYAECNGERQSATCPTACNGPRLRQKKLESLPLCLLPGPKSSRSALQLSPLVDGGLSKSHIRYMPPCSPGGFESPEGKIPPRIDEKQGKKGWKVGRATVGAERHPARRTH